MSPAPSPGRVPPRRRPLPPEAELRRLRRQVRALGALRDRRFWRPLLTVAGAVLVSAAAVYAALTCAGAFGERPLVKLGLAAFAGVLASLVARGSWSTLGWLVLGLVIFVPLSLITDGAYGGEGLEALPGSGAKADDEPEALDAASIRARRLDDAILTREARIRDLERTLGRA